jgi:thiol-disulfide isomerase/thioredoxin
MSPGYPTMSPGYPTMSPGYPTMSPGYPNKKGLFLFCFAEWCGYSKMYKSTWEKIKQQYNHSYDFGIIDMSNGIPIIDESIPYDVHNFIKNGNVTKFPTILFIQRDDNNNIKIDYINDRNNIQDEVLNRFGDFTYI